MSSWKTWRWIGKHSRISWPRSVRCADWLKNLSHISLSFGIPWLPLMVFSSLFVQLLQGQITIVRHMGMGQNSVHQKSHSLFQKKLPKSVLPRTLVLIHSHKFVPHSLCCTFSTAVAHLFYGKSTARAWICGFSFQQTWFSFITSDVALSAWHWKWVSFLQALAFGVSFL